MREAGSQSGLASFEIASTPTAGPRALLGWISSKRGRLAEACACSAGESRTRYQIIRAPRRKFVSRAESNSARTLPVWLHELNLGTHCLLQECVAEDAVGTCCCLCESLVVSFRNAAAKITVQVMELILEARRASGK